jgi:hypothetical protein
MTISSKKKHGYIETEKSLTPQRITPIEETVRKALRHTAECDAKVDEIREFLITTFFRITTDGRSKADFIDTRKDDRHPLEESHVLYALKAQFPSVIVATLKAEFAKSKPDIIKTNGQIVYQPNNSRAFPDEHGYYVENKWREPLTRQVQGDVRLWFDFLKHLIPDPSQRSYFLDLLKHKIQKPLYQPKQCHAVWIYSPEQGIGKSLLGNIIERVVGTHNVMRSEIISELKGQNGPQYLAGTFLLCEESNIRGGTVLYDYLKTAITSSTLTTNYKNRDKGVEQTPAMPIIFTNRVPDFIEEGDRRFFVPDIGFLPKGKDRDWFFQIFTDWLEHYEGYEKVSWWLHNTQTLKELDDEQLEAMEIDREELVGYDPTGAAMMTKAKQEAISPEYDDTLEVFRQFLDNHAGVHVFTREDFSQSMFKELKMHKSYLQELCLHMKEHMIEGIRHKLFIRNGYQLQKEDNQWWVVRTDTLTKQVLDITALRFSRYSPFRSAI